MTTTADRSADTMATMTVRLDAGVRNVVVALSREEGRTIGGQVRRLIDEALEARATEDGARR